jgi:hypothetical protein
MARRSPWDTRKHLRGIRISIRSRGISNQKMRGRKPRPITPRTCLAINPGASWPIHLTVTSSEASDCGLSHQANLCWAERWLVVRGSLHVVDDEGFDRCFCWFQYET